MNVLWIPINIKPDWIAVDTFMRCSNQSRVTAKQTQSNPCTPDDSLIICIWKNTDIKSVSPKLVHFLLQMRH